MRQMRRVIRIPEESTAPPPFHSINLTREALRFLPGVLGAARHRLMVIKFGKRGPDVPVTSLPHFETEVDVVERDGELGFVETSDGLVNRALHDETCPRDSRHVMDRRRAKPITGRSTLEMLMSMPRNTAKADRHARVLDRLVRVVDQGAHATDLGAAGVPDHLVEPIRRDYLDVVIEKREHMAARVPDREVVDRRIIERVWVGQDADAFVPWDVFQILRGP